MTGNYAKITKDQFFRELAQNINLEHVVLLGAGASISSRVPSAKQLIWQWKASIYESSLVSLGNLNLSSNEDKNTIQKWLDAEGSYPKEDELREYSFYADKAYLTNESRKSYFESLVENVKPNLGYKMLSIFSESGTFKIILTTNFDGLVEKVFREDGVNFKEITIETSHFIHEPMSKNKTYLVALHGDYKYGDLKNTSSELDSQNDDFKHALERHLYNKHLIVMGYSGRDKSLMDALKHAYKSKGGGHVYWCSFDDDIETEVDSFLKDVSLSERQAFQVVSGDFDAFLKEMAIFCFKNNEIYRKKIESINCYVESDKEIVSKKPVVISNDNNIETDSSEGEFPILSNIDSNLLEPLMFANFLGSWIESDNQVGVISKLPIDLKLWYAALKEFLLSRRDIIRLVDGSCWIVENREYLWNEFSARIFDAHLDLITDISISVLTELNPKFELPPDKHFTASFYDKKLRYSHQLRKGLSETLAWIGVNADSLVNCSSNKRNNFAYSVVSEILKDATWQLWGSLNELLPVLAEASPEAFLAAVDTALQQTPSPFEVLYAMEGDGVTGGNYMSGLYWALEGLAWNEEYLGRVCVVLARLDEKDPGGRWSNRPANSLVDILLPWHPQTFAPIEQRIAAVKAVQKYVPKTAWKVLIELLPSRTGFTSGCHKPKWRNPVAEDWQPEVSRAEYWQQIDQYAALAVVMAQEENEQKIERVMELIGTLDNLPDESFSQFLDFLENELCDVVDDEQRKAIWEKLTEFSNRHRAFSGNEKADWVLEEKYIEKIEQVSARFKPVNPLNRYAYLFENNANKYTKHILDWDEAEKTLKDMRKEALEDILTQGGWKMALDLTDKVERPDLVGSILANLSNDEIDVALLPSLLTESNQKKHWFISAFVPQRFQLGGWTWVNGLNRQAWNKEQLCMFLVFLPFTQEIWAKVKEWLDNENDYWLKANVRPYSANADLLPVVDKLLEVNRPVEAVECLHYRLHKKQPLDVRRTFAVLNAFRASEADALTRMDFYNVGNLIEALQKNPETPFEAMCSIELYFLSILGEHRHAMPVFLHRKLASEPKFFCEIISIIYRSESDDGESKKSKASSTVVKNAWNLLKDWTLIPGKQDDGTFSSEKFLAWLEEAKKLCKEAGRLDVALSEIGKVLFYSPEDSSGLWIHKLVMNELDKSEVGEMRNGYYSEIYNSRGAHTVDPTAKPELELAEKWRQCAEQADLESCPNFAASLRGISESYKRDAERILNREKGWRG